MLAALLPSLIAAVLVPARDVLNLTSDVLIFLLAVLTVALITIFALDSAIEPVWRRFIARSAA